jgi:hypothetical protein
MRPLLIASALLIALGMAPVMAKPTATELTWNLRAVLAPRIDLDTGYGAPPPRLAPDLPRTAHQRTPPPRGTTHFAAAN